MEMCLRIQYITNLSMFHSFAMEAKKHINRDQPCEGEGAAYLKAYCAQRRTDCVCSVLIFTLFYM